MRASDQQERDSIRREAEGLRTASLALQPPRGDERAL